MDFISDDDAIDVDETLDDDDTLENYVDDVSEHDWSLHVLNQLGDLRTHQDILIGYPVTGSSFDGVVRIQIRNCCEPFYSKRKDVSDHQKDWFKIDLTNDVREYIMGEAQKCYRDRKIDLKKHNQKESRNSKPNSVMTI
ncbi:hypothetical protein L484_003697 [Morus notabilis]|uniref:Uncharacterized protein n=1 Tax=Morus notabilis TaxID=981085 RepID=W9SAI4_9ROSA|nr:hypothetical protein L484_003697 [Morus notabilis]